MNGVKYPKQRDERGKLPTCYYILATSCVADGMNRMHDR